MLDSPAPKWNSEKDTPFSVWPLSSVIFPSTPIFICEYPDKSFPNILEAADITRLLNFSTCDCLNLNTYDAHFLNSALSVAGTVLETPNTETSLDMFSLYHLKFLNFVVLCIESFLFKSLSIS